MGKRSKGGLGKATLVKTIGELTATLLPKWRCQEFQIRKKTQSQVVVRSSQGPRGSWGSQSVCSAVWGGS